VLTNLILSFQKYSIPNPLPPDSLSLSLSSKVD